MDSLILQKAVIYKTKTPRVQKRQANQKQLLSDYVHIASYIAIHASKNFDIKLRPRISYITITCYSGDAMHLNT